MAEEYKDTPPELKTASENKKVMDELIKREPIFHHPEYGRTREDFLKMTNEAFFEMGASGRRYSRDYVINGVVKRYEDPEYKGIHAPPENDWVIKDYYYCRKLSEDTYLLTYTLVQEERISRRATIWRKTEESWKILYHQGTIVE